MDKRTTPAGMTLVGETRITRAPKPHCGEGFAADSWQRKVEWMIRKGRPNEREVALVFESGCQECFKAFLEWPFEHQAKVLGMEGLVHATVRQEVLPAYALASLFTIILKTETPA